jgi:hypothetical protein
MRLFFVHRTADRGGVYWAKGSNAAVALATLLVDEQLPNDGRYEIWPAVIPRSNNNDLA